MTRRRRAPTPAFLDLTFTGLDELPAPGEERFARRPAPLAGRRRDHRDRRGAARPDDRARRPARADDPRGRCCAGARARGRRARRAARRRARPTTVVHAGRRRPRDGRPSTRARAPARADLAALDAARGRLRPRAARRSRRAGAARLRLARRRGGARARRPRRRRDSAGARALLVNEPEALLLTGADDAGARPRALGRARPRPWSSRSGADGAVGVVDGGALSRVARRRRRRRGGHDGRRRPLHRGLRLGGAARRRRRRRAALGGALRRAVGDGADRGRGRRVDARAADRRRGRGSASPAPPSGSSKEGSEMHASTALGRCVARARGAARRVRRVARRQRRRQREEGRRGARELEGGRRRQGRRRHAHRLGPGGPRRPGQADQAAQRGVPGQVPERDDQARREVVRRPQHDAQARRLGQQARRTSCRPTRAARSWASSSRAGCCGRSTPTRTTTGGATATRRRCSTSTASPTTARSSATGTSTASRRWARSSASTTTRTRCPRRRRRSPSSRISSSRPRPSGDVPISFGNLDPFAGIHEFQTVQNQYADKQAVRDFVFAKDGASFDTPENQEAATKLQDWAKEGYFTPDFNGTGYDPAWQQFAKGKGPFLIAGTWLTADLADNMGDKVGFMLMPPPRRAATRSRSAARACRSRSPRSPRTPTSRPPTSTSSPTRRPGRCSWTRTTCRR